MEQLTPNHQVFSQQQVVYEIGKLYLMREDLAERLHEALAVQHAQKETIKALQAQIDSLQAQVKENADG